LNGKVERSQLTDLMNSGRGMRRKRKEIQQRIEEWQFVYTTDVRTVGWLGKNPAGRIAEVGEHTALSEVVVAAYDESKERIRIAIGRRIKRWRPYTNRAPLRAHTTELPYPSCDISVETMSVNPTVHGR
jgi:hypothetical protein